MNASDDLLHLALPDDWEAARVSGEYRVSTRGRTLDQEGFVHCSRPHQMTGVANRFYSDITELLVLLIDPDALVADVIEEPPYPGADERFPHVYGPIPVTAVMTTTNWERDDDGIWRRPRLM